MGGWNTPFTPQRILEVIKGVYEEVYEVWDVEVESGRNWMANTLRYGFQTDGFSCRLYVLAGIRAMRRDGRETPFVVLKTFDAGITERMRKCCEQRYILAILRYADGKKGPVTDVDIFNFISKEMNLQVQEGREDGMEPEDDHGGEGNADRVTESVEPDGGVSANNEGDLMNLVRKGPPIRIDGYDGSGGPFLDEILEMGDMGMEEAAIVPTLVAAEGLLDNGLELRNSSGCPHTEARQGEEVGAKVLMSAGDDAILDGTAG